MNLICSWLQLTHVNIKNMTQIINLGFFFCSWHFGLTAVVGRGVKWGWFLTPFGSNILDLIVFNLTLVGAKTDENRLSGNWYSDLKRKKWVFSIFSDFFCGWVDFFCSWNMRQTVSSPRPFNLSWKGELNGILHVSVWRHMSKIRELSKNLYISIIIGPISSPKSIEDTNR